MHLFMSDNYIFRNQQNSMSVNDDSSSLPGTPAAMSNPGTPRSTHVDTEVRATPPPNPQVANLQPADSGYRRTPPPQATVPNSLSARPSPAAAGSASQQQQQQSQSKYAQLLTVIEDMSRDIRPTYSGSKSSADRLKRNIVHSRILVRECLMECERAAKN